MSKIEKLTIKEEEKNLSLQNLADKVDVAFNKKKLMEHILELQPCYYDPYKNWWLWNHLDTKWERVDEVAILNAIETQAQINTINAKERNETLEALKQVSRKNAPMPIQTGLVQFKNTLVDIGNGKMWRARPHSFVTNPIPWELHPEKYYQTPTMDRIFEEWVGKEKVQLLYEILAYCLLPSYPIHRIFCFIGAGMNGKSCFLNLLRKFIGNDNCCSTELDTLLNSRFEVTRLHKKLVCQMGETNFNEMTKTSILKKLSGGDLIGFEYKNKDPFEEINYAKIIIATNNLPATTDKTIGFYRRWVIIDFPNQFSEKKDILSTIPDEEFNALAVKCTLILKDILTERKFTNEGGILDRMQKYEDHSNPLDKFSREFVKESPGDYITVSDFNKKFKEWCREHRHREISEQSVGISLKKSGFEQERKYMDWLFDGKGGQMRVWINVKWKD